MHSLHIAVLAWALLAGAVVAAESPRPDRRVSPLCVILIGGIDSDPTPEQIEGTAPRGQGQSGMYQLAGDLSRRGITAEYFNWNGTRAGKIKEKPPLAMGIATFILIVMRSTRLSSSQSWPTVGAATRRGKSAERWQNRRSRSK